MPRKFSSQANSRPNETILVLNEGVIRHGQTTEGAFLPIMKSQEFDALTDAGVRTSFLRRLSCMSVLRERGVDFYEAAAGKDRQGGSEIKSNTGVHGKNVAFGVREGS